MNVVPYLTCVLFYIRHIGLLIGPLFSFQISNKHLQLVNQKLLGPTYQV